MNLRPLHSKRSRHLQRLALERVFIYCRVRMGTSTLAFCSPASSQATMSWKRHIKRKKFAVGIRINKAPRTALMNKNRTKPKLWSDGTTTWKMMYLGFCVAFWHWMNINSNFLCSHLHEVTTFFVPFVSPGTFKNPFIQIKCHTVRHRRDSTHQLAPARATTVYNTVYTTHTPWRNSKFLLLLCMVVSVFGCIWSAKTGNANKRETTTEFHVRIATSLICIFISFRQKAKLLVCR